MFPGSAQTLPRFAWMSRIRVIYVGSDGMVVLGAGTYATAGMAALKSRVWQALKRGKTVQDGQTDKPDNTTICRYAFHMPIQFRAPWIEWTWPCVADDLQS